METHYYFTLKKIFKTIWATQGFNTKNIKKSLNDSLQELVRDELITRHSYAETLPRVEYELTEKSKELVPIFQEISEWGMYLIDENISSQ